MWSGRLGSRASWQQRRIWKQRGTAVAPLGVALLCLRGWRQRWRRRRACSSRGSRGSRGSRRRGSHRKAAAPAAVCRAAERQVAALLPGGRAGHVAGDGQQAVAQGERLCCLDAPAAAAHAAAPRARPPAHPQHPRAGPPHPCSTRATAAPSWASSAGWWVPSGSPSTPCSSWTPAPLAPRWRQPYPAGRAGSACCGGGRTPCGMRSTRCCTWPPGWRRARSSRR